MEEVEKKKPPGPCVDFLLPMRPRSECLPTRKGQSDVHKIDGTATHTHVFSVLAHATTDSVTAVVFTVLFAGVRCFSFDGWMHVDENFNLSNTSIYHTCTHNRDTCTLRGPGAFLPTSFLVPMMIHNNSSAPRAT